MKVSMVKGLVWGGLGLAVALSLVGEARAECLNYWVNPKTGQHECLDGGTPTPMPPPDSAPRPAPVRAPNRTTQSSSRQTKSMVEYLNHLKQCQPTSMVIQLEFPEITMQMTIQGKQSDRCRVTNLIQMPQGEQVALSCRYRKETIALMTNQKAYRDAEIYDRTGNIDISSANTPEDQRLQQLIGEDCGV